MPTKQVGDYYSETFSICYICDLLFVDMVNARKCFINAICFIDLEGQRYLQYDYLLFLKQCKLTKPATKFLHCKLVTIGIKCRRDTYLLTFRKQTNKQSLITGNDWFFWQWCFFYIKWMLITLFTILCFIKLFIISWMFIGTNVTVFFLTNNITVCCSLKSTLRNQLSVESWHFLGQLLSEN